MYSLHNHSDFSSASRGFADSSIKVEDLIRRAKTLNIKGIAITDHEITSSYVRAKKLEAELDYPVLCGNEIYLVTPAQDRALREDYKEGYYFPHFLLIALTKTGVQQLWELSEKAWENSYHQKGLLRTTTLTTDVERVIGSNKGHVVASQACLGSQISRWALDGLQNPERMEMRERQIDNFVKWCLSTFGEGNFYLEIQPATEEQEEQMMVNDYILNYSKRTGVPYIITTDSHYLSKDLLPLHSAFLNSKESDDRETEKYYKTAYLMSEDELRTYFTHWSKEDVDFGINNTIKIGERAERYSLSHKQVIPKIEFVDGWSIDKDFFPKFPQNYPYIEKFVNSPYDQDRYLMYLIEKGMKAKIDKDSYIETFKRIEEELTEFWLISEKLEDRMSAYFVTMNKLIDLCWNEAQSIVGTGRGSGVSSIINYMLGITQINPLKMPVQMPFFRFMNRERVELADIDWDTPEHKRADVYQAIKSYYEGIGGTVVKCATFGTIGSKSAIQTAGRGLGYNSDEMLAISSLIPTERGFTWSLNDCYYGNEEKERKPIKEFINAVDSYDRLFEVALMIEGLIINRGTHASGILLAKDFLKYNSKMKSPDGTTTSQYDLHDSEYLGLIKYDALTTSALSKIQLTLESLVENGYIEWKGNLKDTYFSVLNPHCIDFDKPEIWAYIANNNVPDLFQFDTTVAVQTVTQIKPQSLVELAQANSLMRLMPKGLLETPVETYVRFKNNINEWYKELKEWGVPEEYVPVMEELMLPYKGVLDTQEAIMIVSQHPKLTNFTIAESNKLRKAVAKKSEKDMIAVEELFYSKGQANGCPKTVLDYIWKVQIARQLMYSFSILHTIAYTFIALQELVLFHYYPSLYWYTACLTVNAGAIENDEEDAKNKSTKYGKVAKAVGDLQQLGVEITPPNINKAGFGFTPDVENNRIIYSLKGINGIGDDVAYQIVNLRPFKSLQHFCDVMFEAKAIGATKVITLIKAGAFDEIEGKDRVQIMEDYIRTICEPKSKLTTANVAYIIENGLFPEELQGYHRFFNFKKYLFRQQFFVGIDEKYKTKKWYRADEKATKFFETFFMDDAEEDKHYAYAPNGDLIICDKEFDKLFKVAVEPVLTWLNTPEALKAVNDNLFNEKWNQYCTGSVSKWEMDSICFYHHEHELANVNEEKYSIVKYTDLPEEPEVLERKKIRNFEYNVYKLERICGTILDKDKNRHTISLLTTSGVVTCKLYAGNFSFYDKQISEQVDGVKRCVEKSWFSRGTLLIVTGYRQGEVFRVKRYSDTVYRHSIAKIGQVETNGDLVIQSERAGRTNE